MKTSSIAILVASSAALAGAAWAISPHFIRGPSAAIDMATGDLTVSFKEVGLGNTAVDYQLGFGAVINCGFPGNAAKQAPTNAGPRSARTTIIPHNGQTTGSISSDASHFCFDLGFCLESVSYSGVNFQDATNHVPSPPAQLGDFQATFNPSICPS
jgi:hypothetical protein